MDQSTYNPIKPRQFSQWMMAGSAALLVLALLWIGRHQLAVLLHFIRDREAVTAYLEPLGLWGPVLYILILGAQVISAIIPGHALMITAGYLYGFSGGLALNLVGGVGASQLAFVLARWAGKPFAQRLIPPHLLQRWNGMAERQGFLFYLICFWFPVIPSNAANYIGGLSAISFWSFFLANLAGRLPGLVIITLIGSRGFELTGPQWGILVVVGVVVIVGGRSLATRIERNYSDSPGAHPE